MKTRYLTAHTNKHGHRDWLETDQLTSEMIPWINAPLTMGAILSADLHYWDGELFGGINPHSRAINPHSLTFHGESRWGDNMNAPMEEIVRSEAEWDDAPIGSLIFSHCQGSEVEMLHLFFLRVAPPMDQTPCQFV